MPLLDHFHPPLSAQRRWESFHGRWTAALADALNGGELPSGYFAEMQISLGGVEVDVASMEGLAPARMAADPGGVATIEASVYAPPAPALTLPATFPDEIEVLVFGNEAGPTLVAAIELISPRNKDRPQSRRAFGIKCLSYLQQGIGLLIVDVVTSRHANMHDEMVELMLEEAPAFPVEAELYAAAYHPVRRGEKEQIDVWPMALELGRNLPDMPLWLRGVSNPVRVALEATYSETRSRLGLP